jgi:hypothetical protein
VRQSKLMALVTVAYLTVAGVCVLVLWPIPLTFGLALLAGLGVFAGSAAAYQAHKEAAFAANLARVEAWHRGDAYRVITAEIAARQRGTHVTPEEIEAILRDDGERWET